MLKYRLDDQGGQQPPKPWKEPKKEQEEKGSHGDEPAKEPRP